MDPQAVSPNHGHGPAFLTCQCSELVLLEGARSAEIDRKDELITAGELTTTGDFPVQCSPVICTLSGLAEVIKAQFLLFSMALGS